MADEPQIESLDEGAVTTSKAPNPLISVGAVLVAMPLITFCFAQFVLLPKLRNATQAQAPAAEESNHSEAPKAETPKKETASDSHSSAAKSGDEKAKPAAKEKETKPH